MWCFIEVYCWLLGNCFRARRTGNGQNADWRQGVRGYVPLRPKPLSPHQCPIPACFRHSSCPRSGISRRHAESPEGTVIRSTGLLGLFCNINKLSPRYFPRPFTDIAGFRLEAIMRVVPDCAKSSTLRALQHCWHYNLKWSSRRNHLK